MRILLLFPMKDGQTGPGIKHAFKKLGHKVKAVDAKQFPHLSYLSSLNFAPDLVFCSRTDRLTSQIIQIKRAFKNVVTCVWNVDTRTTINEWRHLFPLIEACDYYFVVASRLIPEWKKLNPNTFWLPEGFLPAYGKPKEITDGDRKRYTCDVCWIGCRGGAHSWRERYLDTVAKMKVNFKQWGCAGRPAVYDEAHNKAVYLSKINLAASGWPENEKYTSSRDYKILAAGGFLLERHRKRINEVFPPNTFDYYKSPEDLTKKILYWLEHEKERKEMARRGHRWVHENASYVDRMRMALDYMGMAS